MRYWFDTEFIERGPTRPIHLLSIGIVSEDGRELYYEHPDARSRVNVDFAEFGDKWLLDNVRPHLHGARGDGPNPFTRRDPAAEIIKFCSADVPEFWAYFADYDWVVLCQIFGRMTDLPKGWPMYCLDIKQLMRHYGIKRAVLPEQKKSAAHDALNDARWTRDAWLLIQQTNTDYPF